MDRRSTAISQGRHSVRTVSARLSLIERVAPFWNGCCYLKALLQIFKPSFRTVVLVIIITLSVFPKPIAAFEIGTRGSGIAQGAYQPSVAAQFDPRFFIETDFRIADDRFNDFFNKRGGVKTFGYPISRSFLLLGTQVQFFQRRIMQLQPDGSVGLLNVLDPALMPFDTINGATLPQHEPALASLAPQPGSPNYDEAAAAFLRDNVPDAVNGQPVQFFNTFANTVNFDQAFPDGVGDPSLLLGFNLEMWGFPTSSPATDPNNTNFIYQRFQRGIMHFDAVTNATEGLLVADSFKSLITGENLPADLAGEAAGSPFFRQFNNDRPLGLNRPDLLPGTDMRDAFVPELPPLPPETSATGLRFGMQAQVLGQSQHQITGALYAAGFRWLKQQVRWSDFEPAPGEILFGPLDNIVNAATQNQTRLLFSVVTSPPWARGDRQINGPPDDFNKYGDFLFALASRYRGQVQAYEIWNEQNMRQAWEGLPLDPALYIDLLAVAQSRIKQADPEAIVISGGLTPTGVNDGISAVDDLQYLQGMFNARDGAFLSLADAVGAHMAGYNNAPEDFVDFHTVDTVGFKDHPSFYFRRIDQLRAVMFANRDTRQMWITEYEWGSTQPPVPPGFEWTTQLTEAQVSDFYERSIQSIQASRHWVGAVFIWNLNFRTFLDPHVSEQAIFGLVNPGFVPRPMYIALANTPK